MSGRYGRRQARRARPKHHKLLRREHRIRPGPKYGYKKVKKGDTIYWVKK